MDLLCALRVREHPGLRADAATRETSEYALLTLSLIKKRNCESLNDNNKL